MHFKSPATPQFVQQFEKDNPKEKYEKDPHHLLFVREKDQ